MLKSFNLSIATGLLHLLFYTTEYSNHLRLIVIAKGMGHQPNKSIYNKELLVIYLTKTMTCPFVNGEPMQNWHPMWGISGEVHQ